MLEAVIWERIKPIAQGRAWKVVAQDFHESLDSSWPTALCSRDQARAIGVELEVQALAQRFRRLATKRVSVRALRDKALKAIASSGQLAMPPDSMTLWTFFQPERYTVISKAALGNKDAALRKAKAVKEKGRRDAKAQPTTPISQPPPATPKPAARRPSRTHTRTPTPTESQTRDTPESATLETMMAPCERRVDFPGLARGTAAGYVGNAAKGRGGAIQRALKVAVADLVTEDHVPIRDVPKVLLDAYVAFAQQVPDENELITHSHISDWLIEISTAEQHRDWVEFWSVRNEFGPLVVLHVGHDGTRRTDRSLGRQGELMQLQASYFNPRILKAVSFLLSLRFTVGGSAAHTARALAVSLQDGGIYKCKSSPEPTIPFEVQVVEPGVLFDLEADNTGSAVNVSQEITRLTGEQCETWHCPTHINALDGKTPVLKLAGDVGVGEDTHGGTHDFNGRNALNIADKWWYICDKHAQVIIHHWPQFNCTAKASSAMLTTRGLMSKWESMGVANSKVFNHADDIRKFVVQMSHRATGQPGLGTLKRDCTLLLQWMHDPELWFHFLICHEWFVEQIDPTFVKLRSHSVIHRNSGPFLGRQEVLRIALDAVCRAASMPAEDASDATLDEALKRHFPLAHKHLHLSPSARPAASVGGWSRFEIPSQDRKSYARSWAKTFIPQLKLNAEKHWRQFLQGWKFAGLVTDPEVGLYAARIIYPAGGKPSDLKLDRKKLKPQLDELDRISAKDGAQIRARLAADGLFDSPAKRKDWAKLCCPKGRIDLDWTRGTLPELAPWFESRFFGGQKSNYALESGFSVYGKHVEDEQSSELKEAIVNLTRKRQPERDARKDASMRTPKKSKVAQERYEAERTSRAAEGLTEDLSRDSVSRRQLLSRAETLLARMVAAEEQVGQKEPECSEVGLSVAAFGKRRKVEWEKLFKREAATLEAEMREKRKKGRSQPITDPFGHVRELLRARRTESYLANARAVERAEREMASAEAALAAAAGVGDDSDEDEAAPTRKQARGTSRARV